MKYDDMNSKLSSRSPGYLSDEDYMTKFNPSEQFIATANNLNQDPDKPCVNTYPALPTRVNR